MFFKASIISILIVLTLKHIEYKASIIGILMMLALKNINYKTSSDEPEPEFSSSSRAELWRFRAEPSWGTSISELKPSWQKKQILNLFFPGFIIRSF